MAKIYANGVVDYSYNPSKHEAEHINTSSTNMVNPEVLDNGYDNKITAKNVVTGEYMVFETKVVDNVSYLDDGSGFRIIPGPGENQAGILPGRGDSNIQKIERNAANGETYIEFVPYLSEPSPPMAMPSYPKLEQFNVPEPTFSSDLKRESRFIYQMGIDKISILSKESKEKGTRILKDISTEEGKSLEVMMEKYSDNNSSIELSILQNGLEYPVLPNESNIVENEVLFPNMATRFPLKKVLNVRKDGEIISDKYEAIKNKKDGKYSIDYETENANSIKIESEKVSVKVTIRMVNKDAYIPYINKIKLKIAGGRKTLWQEI